MRLTIGAALVALVAVGAVLAELDPVVVVALTAAACVLVALVGRAYAREAAPTRDERPGAEDSPSEELATPELAEVVDVEPEPEPVPRAAVSERSARAILAERASAGASTAAAREAPKLARRRRCGTLEAEAAS